MEKYYKKIQQMLIYISYQHTLWILWKVWISLMNLIIHLSVKQNEHINKLTNIETSWFPISALACCLGDRKVIQPVKSSVLVCWWWQFDWSFADLTAPFVTSISIILSSNKIQNGDLLYQATQVHLEIMAIKMETERVMHIGQSTVSQTTELSL